MAYAWTATSGPEGVTIGCSKTGLLGRARKVATDDWPFEAALPGRDYLDFLVRTEQARQGGEGIVVPHPLVAEMDSAMADRLSLPPPMPHALALKSHGRLDQDDFAIELAWLRYGAAPVRVSRQGAIIEEGGKQYRLPGALFTIAETVQAFAEGDTSDKDNRYALWQGVQDALAGADLPVQADGYLEDLRVFHAAALSLSVESSAERGFTFNPVLFGRHRAGKNEIPPLEEDLFADPAAAAEEAAGGVVGLDTLADESDALLTPELAEIFLHQRFSRDDQCRPSYPLVRNSYLIIDEPLRKVLNLVKDKQQSPDEERRDFLKNPRAAFAEYLDIPDDSPLLRRLFIETEQFAERVTGIGIWQSKTLPFLPTAANSWLPEKIELPHAQGIAEVPIDKLPELRQACVDAMKRGESSVTLPGVGTLPVDQTVLQTIDSYQQDLRKVESDKTSDDESDQASDLLEEQAEGRVVLEGVENFEELGFSSGLTPRQSHLPLAPPNGLIAPDHLFDHQREGFDWLVKTWTSGRPGVLLADDMGLGKTVQTLAFAAWLHAHHAAGQGERRAPFLIVAPTSLLKNWRAEHEQHLLGSGIGPLEDLYGAGLAGFRKRGAQGTKGAELDRDRLLQSSCLLTTYETLANHHVSLGTLRFPLVIFDEIQKLKTPTTINTHAAKTLNADFVIGLTGTPVENRLTDLWSIADRLHPGLLADLKTFTKRYSGDDTASLRELRDLLVRSDPIPPFMLRRMKDTTDLGKALPERHFKSMVRDMPEQQAHAYAECVAESRGIAEEGAKRGAMLEVLQKLRGISLHPDHPRTVLGQPTHYPDYIARSARLSTVMEILDRVEAAGEKALVFIEFTEMQDLLAEIVRDRYGLDHRPAIINGKTPSARRQELVTAFQGGPGGTFDVMILSPRAGGIGLTITAATHVIHLSRWWNPAVEAQCNDRAYRIGQSREVTVYLPMAKHPRFGEASFDLRLDALLKRKRTLSRDLLIPAESESDYSEMFHAAVTGGGQS